MTPDIAYKNGFLDFVEDYRLNGEPEYYLMYKDGRDNFELYIEKLINNAKGKDLPAGWSPCTTLWLVDNKEYVLGVIRIRHQSIPVHGNIGYDVAPMFRKRGYGRKILQLSFPYIKKIGLDTVMVTCEENNKFSQKIILSCGGKLLSTVADSNSLYHQYEICL